jgi:hypothetical protein
MNDFEAHPIGTAAKLRAADKMAEALDEIAADLDVVSIDVVTQLKLIDAADTALAAYRKATT